MLKLNGWKFYEKQDFYIISRYFPTNYLLSTREKNGNFMAEKLACTTLKTCSKLSSLVLGHTDIMCLMMCCTEKDITSL